VSPWDAIEAALRDALGQRFTLRAYTPVSGGSIHDAYCVTGSEQRFFVKMNRADCVDMFHAETAGLAELGQAHGLRVPRPICYGVAGGRAYFVSEFIDLQPLRPDAMAQLGEALADMHGITQTEFGWSRDNYIGSTRQRNTANGSWLEFWRENRLGHQLELAAAQGAHELARRGDELLTQLDSLIGGYQPEASLLHGDLWGGNAGMDANGQPVIFDPALYYGDREADLAMTELFGGFSPVFFEAYNNVWPLPPEYRQYRRDLYQLYHLLNHHHLFGGHYGSEALRVINRLLAGL
jgi:fructosamine-3-kinase